MRQLPNRNIEALELSKMDEFKHLNRYATDHPHNKAKSNIPANAGFRLYRDSPETVMAQVRTETEKVIRVASTSIPFAEASALADYLADVIPGHIERAMERWRAHAFGYDGMSDDQIRDLLGFILTGKR